MGGEGEGARGNAWAGGPCSVLFCGSQLLVVALEPQMQINPLGPGQPGRGEISSRLRPQGGYLIRDRSGISQSCCVGQEVGFGRLVVGWLFGDVWLCGVLQFSFSCFGKCLGIRLGTCLVVWFGLVWFGLVGAVVLAVVLRDVLRMFCAVVLFCFVPFWSVLLVGCGWWLVWWLVWLVVLVGGWLVWLVGVC